VLAAFAKKTRGCCFNFGAWHVGWFSTFFFCPLGLKIATNARKSAEHKKSGKWLQERKLLLEMLCFGLPAVLLL